MPTAYDLRYDVGMENDPLEETVDLAQAAHVAHFMDRVIEQPLFCRTCGARYSQDCICPRYEPPMRGDEDPV